MWCYRYISLSTSFEVEIIWVKSVLTSSKHFMIFFLSFATLNYRNIVQLIYISVMSIYFLDVYCICIWLVLRGSLPILAVRGCCEAYIFSVIPHNFWNFLTVNSGHLSILFRIAVYQPRVCSDHNVRMMWH